MDVLFEASFARDLRNIKDKHLLKRVQAAIEEVKRAQHLNDVRNLKKMQGYDTYYRLRLGDYRVGIELVSEQVIFVRLLHRKDIYRKFP
ncbi:MAG: type II toxin-antitoxin system RelE/ParE family toxin [Ardenticatenaceae bacterium]|nr:type II toxin-antitoxin system RelE/ParE family toxin [Ardenticatenaceae bacterium]